MVLIIGYRNQVLTMTDRSCYVRTFSCTRQSLSGVNERTYVFGTLFPPGDDDIRKSETVPVKNQIKQS